ncbi:hypothetical protein [Nostoc sp.]|uniref:hypothetical protein n=1 Tax=Nostoc sp. TaxID=1180 RepID=UPI002FF59552
MSLKDKELKELFELADKIGNKRYHRLTHQDFETYRKFDYWRYINGDYECGTTQDSKDWVRENSNWYFPDQDLIEVILVGKRNDDDVYKRLKRLLG